MVDPRVCPPKAAVELADVVRRFGPQYTSQYGDRMMPSQKKALSDIAACCTPELGGRLYRCDDCHDTFWHYHCCRNRACPKCHGTQARQWLEERQAELLPCDYFHAVVTVPSQLAGVPSQPEVAVRHADASLGRGGQGSLCPETAPRGTARHAVRAPHLERPVGLSPPCPPADYRRWDHSDGQHWEPARREFLVPVDALSRKIAAQFRAALKAAAPALFAAIPGNVWGRKWVSFCKHYGHGNDAVLTYLSRYVFRTAISNARILGMDQTHVTFRWKDRGADAWRTERLPGVEFLRRFLQHVLPRGFHKVRYYGLWHPSKRDQSNRAWVLLILATPADAAQPPKIASLSEALSELTEPADRALDEAADHDAALPRCPHCGSCRTRFLGEYPRFGVP